jgi:DNA polymerase-4
MVPEFIDNLPIQRVPGVGKKTNSRLALMGIKTLGDVKKFPEKMILDRLGKYGKRLLELSVGIDTSTVKPISQHKSISSEHTLSEDTRNINLLNQHLLRHAEDVAKQLRTLDLRARTITLKLKYTDFQQVTRSTTLATPIQSSDKIFLEASNLLAEYSLIKQVRLIGMGVAGLVSTTIPVQLNLFEKLRTKDHSWEKVDRTVDSITEKFGKDAIRRAAFRKNDKRRF